MSACEESLRFGRPARSLRSRVLPAFFGFIAVLSFCSLPAAVGHTQQRTPDSVTVVEPGAPGTPSRKLPPSTTGHVPQPSQADVDFMQGMIMHHGQAVEMTALIPSHTENK